VHIKLDKNANSIQFLIKYQQKLSNFQNIELKNNCEKLLKIYTYL
jgi:hypothetical protein